MRVPRQWDLVEDSYTSNEAAATYFMFGSMERLRLCKYSRDGSKHTDLHIHLSHLYSHLMRFFKQFSHTTLVCLSQFISYSYAKRLKWKG